MADLAGARNALASAAAERATAAADRARTGADLAAARALAVARIAAGDPGGAAEVMAEAERLAGRRRELTASIASADALTAVRIGDLLGEEIDLEPDVPLVLLPLRLECRSTPDQAALRVRIHPDTVHVESLDEGLDDVERAAGTAYWEAAWAAADTGAPFGDLVVAVGAPRAPWVAEALRPLNPGARGVAPPEFPDPPPRAYSAAVARTLPDRFVVRVEQAGADPVVRATRPVRDELAVGLAGVDDLVPVVLDGQDLPPVDESLRWLVDYDAAVEDGMAVTVPLALPATRVDRVLVYGVRAALSPADGAARLERLLRSHRFTDGAEFLAQGTPTNNTDTARAGWTPRTPPGAPALDVPVPSGRTNAAVAARVLGVAPTSLGVLPRALDGEQERAAAFHTLLWDTTWGEAIEHLTHGGRNNGELRLDSATLDDVREHWVSHVRGRGPVPALRLGRQPYGVLPVVATDGASWKPLVGGTVEDRVVPFLDRSLRPFWDSATAGVPTVMDGDLDTVLPQLLGTDATLLGLRVRTALAPDRTFQTAMGLAVPDLDPTAQHQVATTLLLLAGIGEEELRDDVLGGNTRSLALPLVHETDQDFVAALLEPDPPARTPASVLQVLLAHAAALERHRRTTDADPRDRGFLLEAVSSADIDVDAVLVRESLSLLDDDVLGDVDRVAEAAAQITRAVGRLDRATVADRAPFAALRADTTLAQLAGEERSLELVGAQVATQILGEVFGRRLWGARFREALETVAGTDSIEERRLLLASTLDACSHRLDAWLTSAATRRVSDLRNRTGAGAFLGAYGWLEDIALVTPTPAGQVDGLDVLADGADGGFVHAPGLTHAATAAVLRSGRLTHGAGEAADAALDIDLSSTRVRDALTLLDGMRRGQELGALLGYRLERRLHEAFLRDGLELDRFIYVLRTLAPLRAGRLTAPGTPVVEAVAASDVVDGLALMAVPTADVRAGLEAGPRDKRYIPEGTWRGPGPGEAQAVVDAIDELARTHDAVADLLLAESVHQVVSGNPARAAAAMDALAAGESVPPEPDVVRTPRSGTSLTHRVALLVPDPPPAFAGWSDTAPRALAEPRLEAWARSCLQGPDLGPSLRVGPGDDGPTLADAGLCALDVLHDADGDAVATSSLATRVVRAIPAADVSALTVLWEMAGLLRAQLTAGRALDLGDVGRPPVGEPGRSVDAAEWLARAQVAVAGLEAALDAAAVDGAPVADLLAPYGLRPAGPDAVPPVEGADAAALVDAGRTRVVAAQALVLRAQDPATGTRTAGELAGAALAEVFGPGFVSVPVIRGVPGDAPDAWSGATGPGGVRPGAGEVRVWLARAGRLREAASAYGETVLLREAFGRRPLLAVVQAPAGYGSWVGVPFPDGVPPQGPVTATVAEVVATEGGDAVGARADLSGDVAGLVVDEWTETVPRRLLRGDPAAVPPELVDVTTTGLAVNANAPGARPPQAILVACSSDGGAWTGERLAHVLTDTMELARMRALTLPDIPFVARYLPALYVRDWSLQGEPTIDGRFLSEVFTQDGVLSYLTAED